MDEVKDGGKKDFKMESSINFDWHEVDRLQSLVESGNQAQKELKERRDFAIISTIMDRARTEFSVNPKRTEIIVLKRVGTTVRSYKAERLGDEVEVIEMKSRDRGDINNAR